MKKTISIMAALALTICLPMTTFAASNEINQDTPAPKQGTTSVTLSIEPTYTVTIPDTITLDKKDTNGTITYEKDLTITAQNVRLPEDYNPVEVFLDSDYTLRVGMASYSLPYTVKVGGNPITDDETPVASFTTNTSQQESTMHIAAGNPQYAGTFSSTVTFIVGITN